MGNRRCGIHFTSKTNQTDCLRDNRRKSANQMQENDLKITGLHQYLNEARTKVVLTCCQFEVNYINDS